MHPIVRRDNPDGLLAEGTAFREIVVFVHDFECSDHGADLARAG
jgi:hypothetical protein